MIELDRAQARLQNIRSVQPILSALHTISLGSWQAALNRQGWVRRYMERLETLLPLVTARLPSRPTINRRAKAWPDGQGAKGDKSPLDSLLKQASHHEPGDESPGDNAKVTALLIGSERGLCGRFNAAVVERAEAYLADQKANVELMALGSRARRILERHNHQLAWSGALSITTLPPFELASHLSRRWLARYEARDLDAVDLIYNAYRGLGSYEPTVTRLIPPPLPLSPPHPSTRTCGSTLGTGAGGMKGKKISAIIETDPLSLYTRVIEQWTETRLYELLLESATAEHSTRYELMGAATQNADRLIDELTLAIQTTRQQAITQEMQELAAGAGMIGTRNN